MPSSTEQSTKSPRRTRAITVGLAAFAIAAAAYIIWPYSDVPYHANEARQGRRPLMAAKTWYYNLSNVNVDAIAKVDADVLVIDFGKDEGKNPLTASEVERLKTGPNGKRRYIISYFSIGEAEEFRFYWRPEWKETPPSWDAGENCAWPKAHKVRYWQDDWKDIIIRGPNAYLKQIAAAGFDGVYLDRVDVYEHHKNVKVELREEMKKLVAEIKQAGVNLKPGFFVIAQNAEDLLTERDYRASIDGLGKEDLLYGGKGTGVRNDDDDIAWSLARLNSLRWDYKPVFVVEYPVTKDLVQKATAELVRLGMVPTMQHRSLDGSDPTDPNVVRKPGSNVGTPEYIAEFCKNKPWW
ncbi:MAG: endo alpha-1,4 polygalactosaminidase [Hyphomicrobiaceae bacterium]|nr:endo alpha-1,4 polygalactosaminidase [Hyphomicrobiaceae bacterium]